MGRIHTKELVLVEIDAAPLEESYGGWMVYVFVGIETSEIELPCTVGPITEHWEDPILIHECQPYLD